MPTALIIGASRGIGHEFVRQYRADGWRVLATARDQAGLDRLDALGAECFALDLLDPASVSGLEWRLDGVSLDVAVVNAGVYGPNQSGLEAPSRDDFDTVMRTNVLGPMRVIPQLADALAPGGRLAVMSSRMGSISERSASSGWLYRASKAALNSVLKDASLAFAARGGICVALHPGWVRTDMGGPQADLDVQESVAGLRGVLASLTASDNGGFRDFDGGDIPW